MSWNNVELGNLCDVLDSQRRPISKRDRKAGEYPYYGAAGIVDYVGNYIFDEKLVLIGEDGAKWESGERTAFIANGKYWVNNHAHVIRPKRDLLLDEWLVYYFYYKDLKEFVTGLTVPKLNQGQLKIIPIPLPPISTQQKIVAKLDLIFAEIDKATAAADTNAKNAEALFQSYLTQTFQRQDGNFTTKKISEIAKIKGGKRVPKGYEVKTEKTPYVYLRVSDFGNNGTIDTDDLRYVDKEVREVIKNYIINSEDLYISIAGTIGRTGIVPKNLSGSLLTENACRLVFDENINNRYVYYFTKSSNFISQTIEHTRTAAQPKLALSRLGEITLSVPSFETQKSIVSHLDKLNEEVDKLKLKYSMKVQFLKILKNSILNKAFAGELVKE